MYYRSFLKHDYSSRANQGTRPTPRHWLLRGLVLAVGVAVLGVVLAKSQEEPAGSAIPIAPVADGHDTEKLSGTARITLPLSLPESQAAVTQDASPDTPVVTPATEWTEVTVRPGDSLSAIFSRLEIHSQLAPLLALGKPVAGLKQIRPGERLRVLKGERGLEELLYDLNETQRLHVTRAGDGGLQAELIDRPIETRVHHAAGVISSSLFQAGLDSGLSENLIMSLAEVFGWDIDFALDIRQGDQFTLVYEELYRDGAKLRDGRILAAEFVNQGRSYQAVMYTDPSGKTDYYSPDGRSMRKAFLRAPVDFRRISSRFSGERWHPVLGVKRPHRGVDYAAAVGTPIKAAGDGKVIFRGVKGGYGNVVIIQHGATYSTLYGHMSRFAKGVGVGQRVRQGQTIGYVGQTGLATGPHLHYEFRVNGVHRNPLTVKLPSAEPLPSTYMADFQAHAGELLAQLDLYRRTILAQQ